MTIVKLIWLAALPVAFCAQSLPPLGEPLLNANGQNAELSLCGSLDLVFRANNLASNPARIVLE